MYYNNYDFTDLFLTRVENIKFGSYGGYLTPFPLTSFSVRWTGQLLPQYSETYTLLAYSHGDVRFWVNGALLVNEWNGADGWESQNSGGVQIALKAGQKYDIRFDYRGISSQGDAGLVWSSEHIPFVHVQSFLPASQLYPTTSGTNHAPTINKPAWADMPVVEFPAGTTVRVEACDQNEADTLSYAWSKLSGPGTVTFATPTGTVSAVSFSAAGSYVLRATVSDGKGGVVTSDVTVTVNAAGSPPVVLGNYSALTIAENADTDGFCVRLSKAPSNTVTVTIARTAGDPGINMRSIASGNGATTFNSSDWSTWKAFRTGTSQDGDATNDTATFTLSVPGYVSATVTVTEVDDDTTLTLAAGTGGTVSPAGATVVTKGAATIISAVSAGGYCFGGWIVTSGAATFGNSGASETTVTISAPATIQADFVLIGGGGGVDPDTDGDGLLDSVDPDDDNDGMSDVDEAVAGTIPTNPLSVLRLTATEFRAPTSMVVRWQSASNRWYTVQAATNLLKGFDPIPGAGNIPATYPVNVYTDDTATVGQKFYRIRVQE
jgi:hypothetical protein